MDQETIKDRPFYEEDQLTMADASLHRKGLFTPL